MTAKEQPPFVEIFIGGKYILRFNRTWSANKDGEYIYTCAGTPTEIERLQNEINSALQANTTTS